VAQRRRDRGFAVGTFGLGFTIGGLVFGRWRKARRRYDAFASNARATAAVRLCTPSLPKMFSRCVRRFRSR
jgi:hypothetical protein